MAYRLRYDRYFWQRFDSLPGDVRGLARELIRQLTDDPHPPQAKELDEHPGFYRLWLPRQHRLVWKVLEAEGIVDLLYIGPKSQELYDRLGLGRKRSRK